jgi:homoserine kinase
MIGVEHPHITRVVASAPGGIGNIGPGLDVLGCAVEGPRDEVTVEWCEEPGVSLRDAGHEELPRDPLRHSSALAASAVLTAAAAKGLVRQEQGIVLSLKKRLPLSGGQGGSAASAVAGAVAANVLLGGLLDETALLQCCLEAEATVAGRHLDNVAPALLGGIVLVRSVDPIDVTRLPVPTGLRLVLAHPAQRLSTAEARRALPSEVSRAIALHQMAQTSAMVAACFTNDLQLFGRAIDDRIAEPARAPLLQGFSVAKEAALRAGALGASISGAGPTMFAVVGDAEAGARVADAIREAYRSAGIECTTRVTSVDERGAQWEAA